MCAQNVELLKYASAEALARAAASSWLEVIESAGRARQTLGVALSGGRITQQFFNETVAQAGVRKVSFDCVHFFWADERCVPPADPESNFKLANERLFQPLGIVTDRIHRVRGEETPERAAEIATAELLRVSPANSQGQPVLDLIFLGMGEDGHVASLFPNTFAKIMDNSVPFLVIEDSPKPPPTRISLSYKTIIAAKNIWVLISGAGKAAALRESLSPEGHTPLARIMRARPVKIFSAINEI
jgi:6-phosphogluconolactonase